MAEQARAAVSELERAEIPWVVSYLREDIQDLRNEVRENRRSIERLRQDMDAKIEGLDAKIDRLRRDMGVQLRWIIGIVIGAMFAMTGVFAWIVDRMLTP